jgi:tRNA-2-methylthio-N6-dimethylallyladenosine synthase
MKSFFVETFGCQMNVNDSEKVVGLLEAQGYRATDDPRNADLVFVNTCAVRERAAEKLYHSLGRLRRLKSDRPEMMIGVGGCVAQLQGEAILERAPQVDVLVGTHNLASVPDLMQRARDSGRPQVNLDRAADSFTIPDQVVAHTSPVRAYVTAIEGCNHVCSFCVVPRTRGPESCRPADAIVAEVRALVARGYPEVMLLGQTVNAYRDGDLDFAGLLARVDAVPGLERVRFTTSHPEHVTERMADALRDLERLCPYLHLPVQSGSDRILASMRRGYTRSEYLRTIELLRWRRPDLALSSDIIVGYPGETEADFAATVELCDKVGFDGLFVFAYSPRPGTTAFRLPDDVPSEEKQTRLRWLNERQQRWQAQRNAARVGNCEEVLVEADGPDGRVMGRTPHFRIVHLDRPTGADAPPPAALLGRRTSVLITAAGPNSLKARLANTSLTRGSGAPILGGDQEGACRSR